MGRTKTRSAGDEVGQLLLGAGRSMLDSGVSLDELTIADVLQYIEAKEGRALTQGVFHPRFGTLAGFKSALLQDILQREGRHREEALRKTVAELMHIPADGSFDPAEATSRTSLGDPDIVIDIIKKVATAQEEAMEAQRHLALRLYALAQIEMASETPGDLKEAYREIEAKTTHEWVTLLNALAEDLELEPAGREGELDVDDFEIAFSCLLQGMAIRNLTQPLPRGLYLKLILALVAGFFVPKDQGRRHPRTDRQSLEDRVFELLSQRDKRVSSGTAIIDWLEQAHEDASQAKTAPKIRTKDLRANVAKALAAENMPTID